MNNNITKTIGQTPMLKIAKINIKLETTNPTGSVKDRMAAYVLKQAKSRGELKGVKEIIEITSGNTGIAFAMLSAIMGYKFTAVMPESMSIARRKIMKAFGANLILTPAKDEMFGALEKYNNLIRNKKNIYLPRQFFNEDNIIAHEKFLGREIIKQTKKRIDIFVAGAGTGGTLIGVARALKKINPLVKIVAIEPAECAPLSRGKIGHHGIQGIGEGFIPDILKRNLFIVDEIITIKTNAAIKMQKILARKYGILVGVSSGANFLGALQLQQKYGKNKNIVTLFPDRGEKYL